VNSVETSPKRRRALGGVEGKERGERKVDAMESRTECGQLAERFRKMAEDDGLLDVKFFLRNQAEAATEQVCEEVNALYRAVDEGKVTPLDFGDSRGR
jgi:hypothetical protein